ncbi:hypothetical protein Gogos_022291 [Gossypium gossypioides]|uniref:Uncharacterized protein n=1 Tax=Gossypium gossypioides TaxID=34282 RepID=A0A7J9CYU8_GOSGO|nr:hypothetical protein [Gossypium gossypioides]
MFGTLLVEFLYRILRMVNFYFDFILKLMRIEWRELGHNEIFFPIRAINPNQECDFKWYISLCAQSRRIVAWMSRFLVEDGGEKGSSYGNSNINNG